MYDINIKPDETIVYLRKSRNDDPMLSVEDVLERHEKILDEWAEKNLGSVVPEQNKYREIVSGETIQSRPEIQKILRLIESNQYKAILIVEIQRLSRGDLEDAGKIIKLLRYTHTVVITPQKTYNIEDEYDRDFFERELKRGNEFLEYTKRIMARGRLESVKDGNYIGSTAPYGYDKIFVQEGKKKCPTLTINEREADVVRMIFDWYVNDNIGKEVIAHRLNDMGIHTRSGSLWSRATISDILRNDHLNGKVRWARRPTRMVVEDGKIIETREKLEFGKYYIFPGKHEAIIDDDLFMRAKNKKTKNPKVKNSYELKNIFSGLIFCQCGRTMTMYRCALKGNKKCAPRLMCSKQTYCHTPSVLYYDVVDKIIGILKNCIEDFEISMQDGNENKLRKHNEMIDKLKSRLIELDHKELVQWEKYSEENMPKAIFDKLNQKVLEEKQSIKEKIDELYNNTPSFIDYQDRILKFTDAVNALTDENVSAKQKNELLKSCIERITYSRERAGRWEQQEYSLDVVLKV